MNFQDLRNGRFYNEDCFDAMKEIPDGVIDMILADLPYGTTKTNGTAFYLLMNCGQNIGELLNLMQLLC